MKWLTRSVVPSMAAFAAVIAFLPSSEPSIKLTATDFRFSQAQIVVHVGDSVSVRNRGKATHTFTCAKCEIDSRNIAPGQFKVVHFAKAGTFSFACIYHQDRGMVGRVVVLEKGQAAPPRPSPVEVPSDEPAPVLTAAPVAS